MSRNSCPHLNNLVQIVPAELCQQKKVSKFCVSWNLHGRRKKIFFFDCITTLARATTSGERDISRKKKKKREKNDVYPICTQL